MTDASVEGGPAVPAADVAAQADPVAAKQGKWTVLKYGSEVLAVHAALLPTGKVVFSAGSGNSTARFNNKDSFGNEALRDWTSVVWDPTTVPPADIPAATGGVDTGQDPQFFHPATTRDAQGNVLDMFCGGETPLPDGRVMSNGGTLAYDGDGKGFAGRPEVLAFDPAAEQWTALSSMAHGRWYPTVSLPLSDARPALRGMGSVFRLTNRRALPRRLTVGTRQRAIDAAVSKTETLRTCRQMPASNA